MLSLYKLEIFNTVAVEGSFSRAAGELLLTQPSVSQHIRDLENSLQVELFLRGNRGVQLTTAGETLLDYTRCILRLVAEAEQAVAHLDQLGSGQIVLGATPTAGIYLLPEWLHTFQVRFPNLATILRTDTTRRIAESLVAAQLDLGFVEGEIELAPSLNALVLQEIALFVIVGPQHAWWQVEAVDLVELNDQAFIHRPEGSQTRTWVDKLFRQAQVRPRVVAEFDHPEAIKQAVASGMGITILPELGLSREIRQGKLRALPVRDLEMRRTLKLIWNADHPLKPASRAFLGHLSDQFPQLAQLAAIQDSLRLDFPSRQAYKASLRCVRPDEAEKV